MCVLREVIQQHAAKKLYSCKKIYRKHDISICSFVNNKPPPPQQNPVNVPNQWDGTSATASISFSDFDNKRKANNVQLLFDTGSQQSHVSGDVEKKLNLPTLRKGKLALNTF